MSKRLDILGARIFGASICHARKYLQPFQKCPNVWTKFPNLAIMHKYKLHIIRIKTCICAFCYFINFLHTFLDIFNLLYLFKILISDKKAQKYREFQPYWDKIFLPQAAEMPCIFKCFLYHLIYNANHDSETYFIILRFCLWQNFIFIFHQPCPA